MSYSLVCPIPDEIDRIDNRILDLLGQRKDIVSKLSDVKRRHQLKVLDRTREASLLEDRRAPLREPGLAQGSHRKPLPSCPDRKPRPPGRFADGLQPALESPCAPSPTCTKRGPECRMDP